MSSDERLVRRAKRGDPNAIEAIYRLYHQDLYRFCRAMVGNPQDAQDTLQNTMVKVLRALPGEERQIQLKPWLYRIARNEAVETLRKRRDNVELEAHQAITVGVTETAETRERLRTLLADLEALPERQRAVLVMRELSGLDFDQIGASFETSAAVARQTLYEARLSLRQLEAGREMRCVDVMKEISSADGRVTRRREIRAHLSDCTDCRAFRDDIVRRREDLAALTPLPLAASAALLQGVLGKAAASGGAGLGSSVGAGAGQAVATSAIVKSAATIAVVAVVGVSAADRGGVVDLPLPGGGGSSVQQEATNAPPSGAVGPVKGVRTVRGKTENRAGNRPTGEPVALGGKGQHAQEVAQARDGAEPLRDNPSESQSGQNPPGGGYGRSASEQNGRPDGLPSAAGHGQQTAAAHKPAQAASPHSPGGSGKSQTKSEGAAGSGQSAATPEPKAKAPPAEPTPPAQAEAHAQANNEPEEQGPEATPPGLQR